MGFANRDSKGWDSREGYRNQKWDVFGWIPLTSLVEACLHLLTLTSQET